MSLQHLASVSGLRVFVEVRWLGGEHLKPYQMDLAGCLDGAYAKLLVTGDTSLIFVAVP